MTIADAPCAWLTTLRADGSPHTTPVWFVVVEEAVWVASSTVNVKVKNVLRDARVSLAVDGTGARPQVAQGHVLVHDPATVPPRVVASLAQKYDGWDALDATQDGPRVLLEIRIDRWLLSG